MPEERNLDLPGPPLPARGATGAGAAHSRLWWWVRLALVLGMIAGVVIIAKPAQLWRALAGAQYLWLIAAVPFALAATSLDMLKLHWLMKPHGFRGGWPAIVRTNLVVNFVSLFLPGTVGGGMVAWVRLSRPDNLRAQTFVALAMNTLLKIVVVAGAGALALALDLRGNGAYRGMIGPLLVLAALPLAALGLMLWTNALAGLKRMCMARSERIMPRRVHEVLLKMVESLEAYRSNRSIVLGCLAAGAARKLIENFVILFALAAVGLDVSFIRVLWIMCAVEATGMMPFSMAGFGLPQVTYIGLLALFGVGADRGLASQLVAWVAMLPVYLSGAAILLLELRTAHQRRSF